MIGGSLHVREHRSGVPHDLMSTESLAPVTPSAHRQDVTVRDGCAKKHRLASLLCRIAQALMNL